jgi:citrate synthase
MADEITVPKGLVNVIVDKTAIATTDSNGNLLYRGYKTVDLVEKRSFEDAAYLIVYGKLPGEKEGEEFLKKLDNNFGVDEDARKVISILKEKDLMRALRSIVSFYHYKHSNDDDLMLEMAAKFPEFISLSYRLSHGMETLEPIEGSYAERFYHLITGKKDPLKAKYLGMLMILYMEHEFNASTFALRVTASTLADPVSSFTTALATLKGPLHGGANAEILDFFKNFKGPDEAVKYVDEQVAKGEKVMGFGHRIYKRLDPRAQFVKSKLKEIAPDSKVLQIAEAVENRMWEKKSVPANLDFYAAIYMDILGIPQDFYTPLFAASRVFGWIAHYKEQLADNRIIRPSSQYVGPLDLKL